MDRSVAEGLDATDPLAEFVGRFVSDDPTLCYLDGNSLGRLPIATRDRLSRMVQEEWGGGLVRSWERWVDEPAAVGDRLGAALLGAAPGQVLVADSVTVNLYKLATAALRSSIAGDPGRRTIVVLDDEFPTDRYVLDAVAAAGGGVVRPVAADPIDGVAPDVLAAALTDDVALLVTSLVSYRSGGLLDLAAVTHAAHRTGAMVLWDLSHAAGSVPVALDDAGADLAVGCTYKYLNAGPGAPAYLYVAERHQDGLHSPIPGWFGARDQFEMETAYRPADGVARFGAGTPSMLGVAAVDEGVALLAEAGLERVRAKGVALTSLLVDLADEWLSPLGFELASPRDPQARGAHVSLRHPDAAAISAALIEQANVVADVRRPDRLRLGPAPLSTRFTEVWDALARTRDLVAEGRHHDVVAHRRVL